MTTPSARQAHQTRLVAGKITQKLNRPHGNYDHSQLMYGVVHAVHGWDIDSTPPSVDVYFSGSQNTNDPANLTTGLKYLWPYVPTVGDVVRALRGHRRVRSSKFVLGKANGSASPYPLPLGYRDNIGKWVSGSGALWGGPGAPTITLADPSASPPVLGANNGDLYFDLAASALVVYQMQTGAWIQVAPTPFVGGITSAHDAAVNETTLCTSGTFPVTLPAALADADNTITNTGSGTVTVAPPGGVELYGLSGATGDISLTQGESARIRSNGTAWYRVQ